MEQQFLLTIYFMKKEMHWNFIGLVYQKLHRGNSSQKGHRIVLWFMNCGAKKQEGNLHRILLQALWSAITACFPAFVRNHLANFPFTELRGCLWSHSKDTLNSGVSFFFIGTENIILIGWERRWPSKILFWVGYVVRDIWLF